MRKRDQWAELILPAIILTLSLPMLRTIGPYLRDLLDDRLGWAPLQAGLVPFLLFSSAFLTGWLNRRLGLRRLLILSAGGVGLARLSIQLWSGDPIGDMLLAMAGVVCFSLFWPTYLGVVRSRATGNQTAFTRPALGLLGGLALDTALNGVFLTYDFIWQNGLLPLSLVMLLLGLEEIALDATLRAFPATAREAGFKETLPWLALGPFLALQMLIFQNIARLTAVTEWPLPLAFGWILGGQIIALWLAAWWPQLSRRNTLLVGIVLGLLLLPLGDSTPWLEAIALLTGQTASALLLTSLITALSGPGSRSGLTQTGLVYGVALLLMVTFMGLFYIPYLNLPLPFEHGWPMSLAGLIIVLCVLQSIKQVKPAQSQAALRLAPGLALPLLTLPAFVWLTWQIPASIPPHPNSPIRVMTYNVHNGFNTQGQLDLFALSQVIEAQQPDIIALQEVSRGSLVNGAVDMLSWFSQRLKLPYIYTPAGEGLWGQATLSRYPIVWAENHILEPGPVRRSFGYFHIEVGWAKPLQVINTHYQPLYSTAEVQKIHTETIVNFLAGQDSGPLVMMGDLNAEPGMPQLQPLLQRGLIDVVEQAGLEPGYTAHAANPASRIDYILISPDLSASNVMIPPSTASDHLSVAATLQMER